MSGLYCNTKTCTTSQEASVVLCGCVGQQHLDWSLLVGETLTAPVGSSMVSLSMCMFSLYDDDMDDVTTGPSCLAVLVCGFLDQCEGKVNAERMSD